MPDQELFDRLYQLAQRLGYRVYDHLPMENEPVDYPFVVISDVTLVPATYKDSLGGHFTIDLHVWASGEDRYLVAQMINGLSRLGRGLFLTPHFRFQGRPGANQQQILVDQSVPDTVLMHGVLTLTYDLC